jgi:hypothetical protein
VGAGVTCQASKYISYEKMHILRLLLTFSSFQQRFLQLLPNQNGCGRCGLIELLHGWQHQRSRDDGELNSSPVSKNGISQSILLTFSPFMMHSPSL